MIRSTFTVGAGDKITPRVREVRSKPRIVDHPRPRRERRKAKPVERLYHQSTERGAGRIKVCVSLTERELAQIDIAAAKLKLSRSSFLAQAALTRASALMGDG